MQRIVAILLGILCMAMQSAYAKPTLIIVPSKVDAASLKVMAEAIETVVQFGENQKEGEMDRLRRRAQNVAQTALITQGYFTAQVTLQVHDTPTPNAWHIRIEPGPRARVAAVDLDFEGAITLPLYRTRLAALRRAWALPAGKFFTNEAWDKAKAGLLGAISAHDFLLARVVTSRADVYADEGRVHLKVVFDSGPAVRLGALQIQGLKRFPPSLVQRYVQYSPGETYTEHKLNQWQQALQSTGFFRGVFLSMQLPPEIKAPMNPFAPSGKSMNPVIQRKSMHLGRGQGAYKGVASSSVTVQAALPSTATLYQAGDQDTARLVGAANQVNNKGAASSVVAVKQVDSHAAAPIASANQAVLTLPLHVRVIEVPPKRWATSVGVDSDTGLGGEVIYRQKGVVGQPLTLESGAGLNRLQQRAYLDFYLPLDLQGNKDSIGLLVDHANIQGEETRRMMVAATRVQERHSGVNERVSYETRWGISAGHTDKLVLGQDPSRLFTLMGTVDWLRRDVDVDVRHTPRAGNLIGVGVGTGVILDNGQPYSNFRFRGQKWWPIGLHDVVTWRTELGRVWINGNTVLPPDVGFRAGGARSIRGYGYLSIGIQEGDAVVEAPLIYVASLEYDHYFNARWGLGFFVDAGDATTSFGARPMALGYGVGARVSTPAGPLFLDVAYGQRNHAVRLSFSLGTAF